MGMGLYVHVPFCAKKCAYCDFYSLEVGDRIPDRFVELLLGEATLYETPSPLATVFLGGGTPSLLSVRQISALLSGISRYFHIRSDAEITLECNPGTVTLPWLSGALAAGVNRLSFGVQTCDPYLLQLIGRRHTPQEAASAIAMAQRAGFTNLSCDLLYGLPEQGMSLWQASLSEVVSWGVPHISLYSLELHEETPLAAAVARRELSLPTEDEVADMYELARSFLPGQGLLQYEVSNFARSGWQCRHNLNYWHNGQYLGLGPSACSYVDSVRYCNLANWAEYQKLVSQGSKPIAEIDEESIRLAEAETLILGLRLTAGVSDASFRQRFGRTIEESFGPVVRELLQQGLLMRTQDGYSIPERLLPVANSILCRFLPDSNT